MSLWVYVIFRETRIAFGGFIFYLIYFSSS